jgi:hypothetical protein
MMIGKYKVVTLCGSTKFKDKFFEVAEKLMLEGIFVLMPPVFMHPINDIKYEKMVTKELKEMLNDMHKRRIDMSDEIFVINVDGYIGQDTFDEIKYARAWIPPKKVVYLEGESPYGFIDSEREIK